MISFILSSIYIQPISTIVVLLLSIPVIWAMLFVYQIDTTNRKRTWKAANLLIVLVTIIFIAFRTIEEYVGFDEEALKCFLMDMLLFAPFGAAMVSVLHAAPKKRIAMLASLAAGAVLSLGIQLGAGGSGFNGKIFCANLAGTALGVVYILLLPTVIRVRTYLYEATKH